MALPTQREVRKACSESSDLGQIAVRGENGDRSGGGGPDQGRGRDIGVVEEGPRGEGDRVHMRSAATNFIRSTYPSPRSSSAQGLTLSLATIYTW